ncbi:uncharacterized protein LOC107045439 [Diachasma alloeum]|uniref:uncharacterized protein LOC107045439 n=1 Tax=Diachasma alloeum TaxID=454923 RepID=UPI00073851AD|nr:uncharacterized protein LOC107045439 [Diachasma alloeum]
MSGFWESLRKKGKIVDEGIKRLDKQWETPHIFISKYGELVEEASKHLENFLESIKDIHDEIIEDNQPRDNYITDVYRFSDECTNIYEDLRQQAYEIEGLLTEFGYEGVGQPNLPQDTDEDSSILNPEMMESLEITDKYSKDEQENISPNKSKIINMPKFIATPVIKSLASLKREISDKTPLAAFTSSSSYPQEPIYSPYYYKA